MRSLIVRGIQDGLIVHLKEHAVEKGRSTETERRELLRRILTEGSSAMSFGALHGKICTVSNLDETPTNIFDAMEGGPV